MLGEIRESCFATPYCGRSLSDRVQEARTGKRVGVRAGPSYDKRRRLDHLLHAFEQDRVDWIEDEVVQVILSDQLRGSRLAINGCILGRSAEAEDYGRGK